MKVNSGGINKFPSTKINRTWIPLLTLLILLGCTEANVNTTPMPASPPLSTENTRAAGAHPNSSTLTPTSPTFTPTILPLSESTKPHTPSPTAIPLPTITLSSPAPTAEIMPADNPPPYFRLSLGNTRIYSAAHYDTYGTEHITATYVITETVVDTQAYPPHSAVQVVRDSTVITLSDNLAGKDWEEHYLAGPGDSTSFWYVISGTHVYKQNDLNWAAIKSSEAMLEYIFPLSSNTLWYPDPWQRQEFPNFEVTSGLRRISGPLGMHVPAGKFQGCFEVITMFNSGATFDSFCPGIGVVESHYDHVGTPFGQTTVLVDYSLSD